MCRKKTVTLETGPRETWSLTLPDLLARTLLGTSSPTARTAACKAALPSHLATDTSVTWCYRHCYITGQLQDSSGTYCEPGTMPGTIISTSWPGELIWAHLFQERWFFCGGTQCKAAECPACGEWHRCSPGCATCSSHTNLDDG